LTGFTLGTTLGSARRALAAAAGRPTDVARFVYAIGGDNGTDSMPTASVVAAPTALNGSLGSFNPLSQSLPKALSFLSVVTIGRFLYAVGGFDGSAAVKDVSRAQILDPLDTPAIGDVDVHFDRTQGLDPGLYIYRISAVMTTGDDNNPGGETLASDNFPIILPTVSNGKLQVVLYWNKFTGSSGMGAKSYRIFRSPKADDAAGSELLLATQDDNGMATQSYVDNGAVTPKDAGALPLGSTGAWKTLPMLGTARAGAGVAAAPDPATAGTFYIYALAGNSGSPATPSLTNTGEFLTVTVGNNGKTQAVGSSWTPTTKALPTARWLGPAVVATNAQNPNITASQVYLYSATGYAGSIGTNTLDKPVYAAQIAAGGQPGTFATTGSVGVNRAGFGSALVNDQVMAFGGFQAGTATTSSDTANLSSATTLGNFNSLGGGTLKATRALQGTAIESAFIYQLGGSSSTAAAQDTTEQSIW
jgi:hypothetical protein